MSALIWAAVIVMCCVMWGPWASGIAIAFVILPDFPLVGGFAEPGRLKPSRVRLYNTVHVTTLPVAVLVIGAIAFFITGGYNGGFWPVALAGAAWFVHIAADRALGFGLRDADGEIIPVGSAFV